MTLLRCYLLPLLPDLRWLGCIRRGHRLLCDPDGGHCCVRCRRHWDSP